MRNSRSIYITCIQQHHQIKEHQNKDDSVDTYDPQQFSFFHAKSPIHYSELRNARPKFGSQLLQLFLLVRISKKNLVGDGVV